MKAPAKMSPATPPEESGKSGLTPKTLMVALGLSLFLLVTSSYIALKIGALPWPIIFSVIASAGLLKTISMGSRISAHHINVAQAGGSIGGLMASAAVFTIPGIWFLKTQGVIIAEPSTLALVSVFVVAGVLGVLLSVPLRRHFIDREKLSFPSGTAGAEVIKTGKAGGKLVFFMLFAALLAGIFAMAREVYFPAGWTFAGLAALGVFITVYPMPLAAGVGYILGHRGALSWLYGAVAGWLIIIPLLVRSGFELGSSVSLIQNAGMGIILGSGVGFFVAYVLPNIKGIFRPLFTGSYGKQWYFRATPWFSVLALVLSLIHI